MEQLVREESQKVLDEQMRQARIERQKQVRQQAMAFTDSTRKKFEEAKEKSIKALATAVATQATSKAIADIQRLSKQNDLALEEIGMAHRAAQGIHQIEKLKSLKRLKNQEVAKNRGSQAYLKELRMKEEGERKKEEILKRKEEVRREEDRKSKEMISNRRPLQVQNQNEEGEKKAPPSYQPSLAKTLKVAEEVEGKEGKGVKVNSKKGKSSVSKAKLMVKEGAPPPRTERNFYVRRTSSIEFQERKSKEEEKKKRRSSKESPGAPLTTPRGSGAETAEGLLPKMVRIHTTGPATELQNPEKVLSLLEMRNRWKLASQGGQQQEQGQGKGYRGEEEGKQPVRYFDASLPKPEVKYVPPEGLVVREEGSRKEPPSPDAWVKGEEAQKELEGEEEERRRNEEDLRKRQEERGRQALKKAKLEMKLKKIMEELMEEIEQEFPELLAEAGERGEEEAYLGLGDVEVGDELKGKKDKQKKSPASGGYWGKGRGFNYSDDDDFLTVDTSEEDEGPTGVPLRTLKTYKVKEDNEDKHLMLVPIPEETPAAPPPLPGFSSSSGEREGKRRIEEAPDSSEEEHGLTSYSSYSSPPTSARSSKDDEGKREEGRGKKKKKKGPGLGPSKSKLPQEGEEKMKMIPNLDDYDSVSLSEDDGNLQDKTEKGRKKGHGLPKKSKKDLKDLQKAIDDPAFHFSSSAEGSSLSLSKMEKEKNKRKEKDKMKEKGTLSDSGPKRVIKKDKASSSEGPSSSSKSTSTLAEVNIQIPKDSDSDKDSRASTPKKGKKKAPAPAPSTKGQQTGLSVLESMAKSLMFSSSTSSKSGSGSKEGKKSPKKVRKDKKGPPSSSSGSSKNLSNSYNDTTTSNSTVARVKISTSPVTSMEELQLRAEAQERALRTSSSPPTEPELPVQVTLKVRKSPKDKAKVPSKAPPATSASPAIASASSGLSAGSTDYYNLPEGPYTSTPDGKLLKSKKSAKKDLKEDKTSKEKPKAKTLPYTDPSQVLGKKVIKSAIKEFIKRRPESIDNLQVSTSSSSMIKLDLELLGQPSPPGEESQSAESSLERSKNDSGGGGGNNSTANDTSTASSSSGSSGPSKTNSNPATMQKSWTWTSEEGVGGPGGRGGPSNFLSSPSTEGSTIAEALIKSYGISSVSAEETSGSSSGPGPNMKALESPKEPSASSGAPTEGATASPPVSVPMKGPVLHSPPGQPPPPTGYAGESGTSSNPSGGPPPAPRTLKEIPRGPSSFLSSPSTEGSTIAEAFINSYGLSSTSGSEDTSGSLDTILRVLASQQDVDTKEESSPSSVGRSTASSHPPPPPFSHSSAAGILSRPTGFEGSVTGSTLYINRILERNFVRCPSKKKSRSRDTDDSDSPPSPSSGWGGGGFCSAPLDDGRASSPSSTSPASGSGPEREERRLGGKGEQPTLLDDLTPVRLIDSPTPMIRNERSFREGEGVEEGEGHVTQIFENLRRNWAKIKISPPPKSILNPEKEDPSNKKN